MSLTTFLELHYDLSLQLSAFNQGYQYLPFKVLTIAHLHFCFYSTPTCINFKYQLLIYIQDTYWETILFYVFMNVTNEALQQ